MATAGCTGETWLTEPGAHPGADITHLAWLFGTVVVLVWILTLAVATWAVLRGRRRSEPAGDAGTTRAQTRAVLMAVTATLLILFSLAITDYVVARGLLDVERSEEALTVEVVGNQWWWELNYEPDHPARRFTTANELRIPVGRPVRLELRSRDVIHSFWVPRLQGKRDLIPGYENTLWIQADEPGVYRGSCAEFCGIQHGQMKIEVVALPPAEFERWYARQLAPAAAPADGLAARGLDVFETHRCALCHTVRGTRARGGVAPDLTHLASRRTLAAGVLPNRRGYLAGWIADPQHLKPGVHMPKNPMTGAELNALLHYLEGLR